MFACFVGGMVALSGLADAAAQAKLQGYWEEVGPARPPAQPVGLGLEWEFKFGGAASYVCETDHNNESQQWSGTPVLNTSAAPAWLDVRFTDNGNKRVYLGIVRFDGDRVIWATGVTVDAKDYDAAAGHIGGRPKTFARPPAGGGSVRVLRQVILPGK